jgi:two-component system LytT family response regulator
MKKIHCIIVDDEPLARELLTTYISKIENWIVNAACRTVAEAYQALYQNEVDVIFLDINLPDVNGIDFLSTLKNPPQVVFTTAYAEHAAKAFDLHAVDYLVKPITEARFREAVYKVERLRNMPEAPPPQKQETDHLFLKQDNRLVKVRFDDILYVEALKDFSKVFLKEKTMLASAHLKLMEDLLPSGHFIRVHRSYIVAIKAITAVNGTTVEIGKQEIPVGNTYKDSLMQRLGLG